MPVSGSRMGSNRSQVGGMMRMPKKPFMPKIVTQTKPRVEGKNVPKKRSTKR